MKRSSCARRRRGFTLIEVALASTVFAAVLGSALMLVMKARDLSQSTQSRSSAQRRAQTALDRAIDELSEASSTITPDPSGSSGAASVQFQTPLAVNGATITWSGLRQLGWESDPADPAGGGDDDGDGLTDEGQLVFVRDLGALNQRQVVLVRDVPRLDPDELANNLDDDGDGVVDEGGFNVQLANGVLTLRLVVAQNAPGGRREFGRAQASLILRN